MCSKVNVPSDAYKTAYSTMLKGLALDYYHTNIRHQVPTARFEDMYAVTQKYFEPPEYKRGLITC